MDNPKLKIHKSTLMNLYNHIDNLRNLMLNHPSEREVYYEVLNMVFDEHYESMMEILQITLNNKEVK